MPKKRNQEMSNVPNPVQEPKSITNTVTVPYEIHNSYRDTRGSWQAQGVAIP